MYFAQPAPRSFTARKITHAFAADSDAVVVYFSAPSSVCAQIFQRSRGATYVDRARKARKIEQNDIQLQQCEIHRSSRVSDLFYSK